MIGVLAMSYGTARGPDDVEAYYTHVRRGRPPTPELLQELTERYRAIGGRSPLIEITEAQVTGLEKLLNEGGYGDGGVDGSEEFRVYHGMKHQRPYLEDVVEQMAADGIEGAVGLVLAPHYSRFSVGEYVERVERAAAAGGPRFSFVKSYATHPAFVAFVASRVREARDRLPDDERDAASVVFSAHSLPERILAAGDRYPDELAGTADAVASRLGLSSYRTAWQSAGRTGEPWLGPDLSDVLRDMAEQGVPAVVSCPVGFVCDHLEILYDIDIEAQSVAQEVGLTMVRTESPNDDPRFLAALAQVIRDHLEKESA
ncbi:MAG: ferrochelatase [Actinomycetota bacterium]|nr:ferrochelatase [Actinomycetota bacterium]